MNYSCLLDASDLALLEDDDTDFTESASSSDDYKTAFTSAETILGGRTIFFYLIGLSLGEETS